MNILADPEFFHAVYTVARERGYDKARAQELAEKAQRYAPDAAGHEHMPGGSPEGGQFTGKVEDGQSPNDMAATLPEQPPAVPPEQPVSAEPGTLPHPDDLADAFAKPKLNQQQINDLLSKPESHAMVADGVRSIMSKFKGRDPVTMEEQAWQALWSAAKKYDPAAGPFENLARVSIAKRLMREPGKKQVKAQSLVGKEGENIDVEARKEQGGADDPAIAAMKESIAKLTDSRDRAVMEKMATGMTGEEIGNQLGMQKANVSKIAARLRPLLKDMIESSVYQKVDEILLRYATEDATGRLHVDAGVYEGGEFTGKPEHGQSPNDMAAKISSPKGSVPLPGSPDELLQHLQQPISLKNLAKSFGLDPKKMADQNKLGELMGPLVQGGKVESSVVRGNVTYKAKQGTPTQSPVPPQAAPAQSPSAAPTSQSIADLVQKDGSQHIGELYKKYPGVPHEQINEAIFQAWREHPDIVELGGLSQRKPGEWSDEEWKNLPKDHQGVRFGYIEKKGGTTQENRKAFSARPLSWGTGENAIEWYKRIVSDPAATPELIALAKSHADSEARRAYSEDESPQRGPWKKRSQRHAVASAANRLQSLEDHKAEYDADEIADVVGEIAEHFDAETFKEVCRKFGLKGGQTKADLVRLLVERIGKEPARYAEEDATGRLHVGAGVPEGGQFTGKPEHGQSPNDMAAKLAATKPPSRDDMINFLVDSGQLPADENVMR